MRSTIDCSDIGDECFLIDSGATSDSSLLVSLSVLS